MTTFRARASLAGVLALAAQTVFAGIVLGHTSGPGATPEHVLLEVAEWGLAVAAVIGLVVVVFWLRARRRQE